MKKDKKEETMNPLFHWGGLDLQNRLNFFKRFSVKRRQARRVTLEEEWKKKYTKKHLAEQAQCSAFFRQTEAGRKRTRRVSHARKEEYKKRKAKPAVSCTYTNFSSYFSPRHRRRLQQTWFYVEATFSPKKWRLQVNICFYASETYKKVIYLNVNKSLQLFWCFKCVCGQVL